MFILLSKEKKKGNISVPIKSSYVSTTKPNDKFLKPSTSLSQKRPSKNFYFCI